MSVSLRHFAVVVAVVGGLAVACSPGSDDSQSCGLSYAFCPPVHVSESTRPDSETCHFQGPDVVCVAHRDGKPDATTTDSPVTSTNPGDPVPDYQPMANHWTDRHVGEFPPAPEPGREQYLTPYEESLSDANRPFASLRMCADGTMWDPVKIKHCPDGNPGTVQWIHHDGTRVTIGPDSPRGQRFNGGEVR